MGFGFGKVVFKKKMRLYGHTFILKANREPSLREMLNWYKDIGNTLKEIWNKSDEDIDNGK